MLPVTVYTVTIGNNKDKKWNSVVDWNINEEERKGMYVAFMLFGINGISIQNNMKILKEFHSTEYLTKDELLKDYNYSIVSPLQYYRKWTSFDTRNSTSLKVIQRPTSGDNVVFVANYIEYGIKVPDTITEGFVVGLSYASSIAGTHSNYHYGKYKESINTDYWLGRLPLLELPKELLDIIFSYIPGTMQTVNKECRQKARSTILESSTVPPRNKEHFMIAILSNPLFIDGNIPTDIENLALNYIARSNTKYLSNIKFFSKLSTTKLCAVHYAKVGSDYFPLVNPKYVQMLLDMKYKFTDNVYCDILQHVRNIESNDCNALYLGLTESTKLLIRSKVRVNDVNVGSGIGILPKVVALECLGSLPIEFQTDPELISSIASAASYIYNLELFDEISNLLSEQSYGHTMEYIYSNSISHTDLISNKTEAFQNICKKIFSSPRLKSEYLYLNIERITKVEGIRLGLLSNPNFTAYHSKLSNKV